MVIEHLLKVSLSSVQYNWAQPTSHVILPGSQVKLPPRPPGKPPSWGEKKPYFPPVTSNAIDDYNELNIVQTEPGVTIELLHKLNTNNIL